MEGRMIVVKNLPSCSQDTIENYLEVVCDNGVQHIQFYNERVKHIAMVTMEEDIEDFESCQKRSGKRKLEGNRVELLAVAPPNGVLVTGLPPEITQDTIRYYFENKRSGGEDEAVEDCKYHMNLGLATVVFRNTDVVQRVLNVTSHIPIKKKPPVTVQPYYPEFHAEVLDFLADLDPCDIAAGGDRSPVNDNLEEKPQDSPSVYEEDTMKSVVSAQSIKERVQMFEEQRIQETSGPQHMVSIYRRPEPKRVENNTMVSVCGQSKEILSMQSVCVEQEADRREEVTEHKVIKEPMQIKETYQTFAKPLPPKPAPKPGTQTNSPAVHSVEDKIDLPLAHVKLLKESQNVDREFPRCQIIYDIHSGAVNMSGPEEELQKLKIRLYEESSSLTLASNPGPQAGWNLKAEPATEPEVKERVEKASVKFSSTNVRLLEKSQKADSEFPMCKLTYKADSGKIDMEGPETKLQELKLRIFEENHKISSASHPLPQTIADILKTEKGRTYLDKEVKGHNSVWYLDGNTIHCASFTTSDTDNMIGQVKRLILQEYISYNESHFHFLNSSAWTDLKKSLGRNHMVWIVSERDKCQVRIDGLGQDVEVCKMYVEKVLKKRSHKSGTFVMSGAKAKCLKSLFVQDIADLKKEVSDKGGLWDDCGDMHSFNVNFHGDPEIVEKVGLALKHIVEKKVWHERLVLGKDVAKEKDLNLLIRGLHQTNLKAVQAAFEAEHSVFLELNLPGAAHDQLSVFGRHKKRWSVQTLENPEEVVAIPSHRGSTPRSGKSTSTSMTVGNITIHVKKGDILKEEADVLVNVVPKNWDVTATTVSQAFVKAGGEQFKQEIALKKPQEGQEVTGGMIQTKSCGNQPGKMIYTIALSKWNSHGPKNELKTVIDICLKTAANDGYSSMALTSVGCGRFFQYPAKAVASCLIKRMEKNSKLPSLKQVSIVLYDQATFETFLSEINRDSTSLGSKRSHRSRKTRRHNKTSTNQDIRSYESPPPSNCVTVGSTTITVQQGDITKITASVLVNVVTDDLNIKSATVSRALIRAGGEGLLQDFETQKKSPVTNNIIVTCGGNLNCQYVFHVVLKKWKAGSGKEYLDAVRDCFKLAGGYNSLSIAFSSLGCGELLKYPSDFVSSCLIEEAKSSGIANVMFVIYDQPTLKTFQEQLHRLCEESESNDDYDDNDDNEDDGEPDIDGDEEDVDDDGDDSHITDILSNYAKTSKADQVPSNENKSASIDIYGAKKQTCIAAKRALSKQLLSDFLHDEEILLSGHLTRKMFACLKTKAENAAVRIEFPIPEKAKKKDKLVLKLKGENKQVLLLKSEIQDSLISAQMRKTVGVRGSRQFLLHMGHMSDFSSPAYWTHFQPNCPLRDIIAEISAKSTDAYQLVTVDPATFNAVNDLVQKTWNSAVAGCGKDAVGLQHSKLEVKQVQRLEHPQMYNKYCLKRSGRFSDACSAGGPFCPVDQLQGSKSAVLTTMNASAELQQEMYLEVNEHYFFHGTKPENVQAILDQGLDSRVGRKGMLGSGVYGAESSTKADQYTDNKHDRSPGDKKMVLTRMTLGLPYVCSSVKPFCRPPCRDLSHLDDKCKESHGSFHSVIGDGKWLFREFVVYEPDLCYPEFVITYARV